MRKEELNQRLLDQMLIYVADESMEDLAGEYTAEDDVCCTPGLEKRISRVISKARRRERLMRFKRVLPKIVIAVLVNVTVFSVLILSVEAIRVPFLNMFSVDGENSRTIYISEESADYGGFEEQMRGTYMPSYLPAGFSVEQINGIAGSYSVRYKGPQDSYLSFKHFGGNSTVGIDTEGAQSKEVTIGGEPAQLITKNGLCTLVFQFEGQAFMLSGQLPEEEIIKTAESLKLMQ